MISQPGDFDVSALHHEVAGYVVAENKPMRYCPIGMGGSCSADRIFLLVA
jgi:hypothetical protein